MTNDLILFPSFRIKTVQDLMRWHDELLEVALRVEFERKAMKTALETVSRLKRDALRERELTGASKLETKILTEIQADYQNDLASSKNILQVIYSTNEAIVTSMLEKDKVEQMRKDELSRYKTPILHGIGWRFEYDVMRSLRKNGFASFLTYGSLLEPHQVDIVAFKPEDGEVKIKLRGLRKAPLKDIFRKRS